MEKIAVERSIWINASLEQAWGAVTEPEQLNRWYATDYHWDIPRLKTGRNVRFYNKHDDSDAQVARIEVVDPLREFTLRWKPHPQYPVVSLVTSFLLEAESAGTRVTIRESGYEAVADDERQQWLDACGILRCAY